MLSVETQHTWCEKTWAAQNSVLLCFVCLFLSSSLMSQNMQLGFESSTTLLHILNNILDAMDRQHFVYCCWIYTAHILYIHSGMEVVSIVCSRVLFKCGVRVQGQEVLWPSDVHSKCCIILIWFDLTDPSLSTSKHLNYHIEIWIKTIHKNQVWLELKK